MVWKTFKSEIIRLIIIFHISTTFRVAFSVLILELFHAVEANDQTMGYVWIAILTVLWYLYQITNEVGLTFSHLMGTRLKSALAMLLYAKVSKMTSFVLNSSEIISKITNLIANDLVVLEARVPVIMHAFVFPYLVIAVTILLVVRIGWPALTGIAVIIITIFIMLCVSGKNR